MRNEYGVWSEVFSHLVETLGSDMTQALTTSVVAITGGPVTGKTTLSKQLLPKAFEANFTDVYRKKHALFIEEQSNKEDSQEEEFFLKLNEELGITKCAQGLILDEIHHFEGGLSFSTVIQKISSSNIPVILIAQRLSDVEKRMNSSDVKIFDLNPYWSDEASTESS